MYFAGFLFVRLSQSFSWKDNLLLPIDGHGIKSILFFLFSHLFYWLNFCDAVHKKTAIFWIASVCVCFICLPRWRAHCEKDFFPLTFPTKENNSTNKQNFPTKWSSFSVFVVFFLAKFLFFFNLLNDNDASYHWITI